MLRAQAVRIGHGALLLHDNVSMTVAPGQLVLIRGANGSGKTTLLRILLGLHDAGDGIVSWYGCDSRTTDGRDMIKQHVCAIGHALPLKPMLRVNENLRFLGALYGCTDINTAAVLSRFQVPHLLESYAGQLSAGQKKRVMLGLITALPVNYWLLDEPASALDSEGIALFEAALLAHLDSGGAAIIATHHPFSDTVRARAQQLTFTDDIKSIK